MASCVLTKVPWRFNGLKTTFPMKNTEITEYIYAKHTPGKQSNIASHHIEKVTLIRPKHEDQYYKIYTTHSI